MNNPGSWDDGSGNKKPIVEGNPDEGSDNYAKWHGFNVWEDDIKYCNYSAPHGMSSYLTVLQQQV